MLRSPDRINTKKTIPTLLAHQSKTVKRQRRRKTLKNREKKEYYLQSSNDNNS